MTKNKIENKFVNIAILGNSNIEENKFDTKYNNKKINILIFDDFEKFLDKLNDDNQFQNIIISSNIIQNSKYEIFNKFLNKVKNANIIIDNNQNIDLKRYINNDLVEEQINLSINKIKTDNELDNYKLLLEKERKNIKKLDLEILDLKTRLEHIEKENVKIEEKSKLRMMFLSNTSHELRTPLNGALGMTELLLNTKLTEQQIKYAKIIYNSGETVLALINDILDYAKIEFGKMELEDVNIKLDDLIEDINKIFFDSIEKGKINLVINKSEILPKNFKCDPLRLKQIITNLIGNAIKFCKEGDTLIKLSIDLLSLKENIAHLKFTITDNGIGIEKDKLEKIFDDFSQADKSISRKYGGTGLGLTISKELVEKMNGKMGVDSIVNKGTSFWFSIEFEIE